MRYALLIIITLLMGCGGNQMNIAEFETTKGTFTIELETEKMPITTKNFIDLAQKNFYDGTRFHRIIPNFMIQGGDPLSKDPAQQMRWGTGGPGYNIKDEFDTNLHNDRGTIAMANAGPNTGGSQFFVNVVNNRFLDSKHPVFGHVTSGMEIIDQIVNTPTNARDQPSEDIIINKITIK